MIQTLEHIGLWVVGGAILDWYFVTRLLRLFAPSIQYRYWPPSKLRLVTLGLLMAAAALDELYKYQADWTLFVSLFAFIAYGAAVMADAFQAQGWDNDGPSSRLPPRYSERDDRPPSIYGDVDL